MIYNEQKYHLEQLIYNISSEMENVILFDYYDKMSVSDKYLLSVAFDAFKSFDVLCYSYMKTAFSESGSIIRKLLEEISIFNVLVNQPDLVGGFIEHYKYRRKISDLNKTDQQNQIRKDFNLNENYRKPLSFIDYGWLSNNSKEWNEKYLITKAGLEDLLPWKAKIFDKLVHSSIVGIEIVGPNYEFPLVDIFMQITFKLFDVLCCNFHNFTSYCFEIKGQKVFELFRRNYISYLDDLKTQKVN